MNDHHETNVSIVRQNFGGDELALQHDTASTAVAARARAQIEARCIMAIKRPRNWDDVRQRLLKECKRPGFAQAARYHKPIGEGIEGPSIRFAEAAIRYMTNLSVETTVTYDDTSKLILRVSVSDLESNVPYEQDIAIAKTVERRKLGRGQKPLSQRTNSFGDVVYIVAATDDEILNKVNALVSKALRTLALRLLPGDILDECMDTCIRTTRDADAKDPDAARKKLTDSFFSVGIGAGQLAEYLGHDLASCTPAELQQLRAIFAALRDGETTWNELMDARSPAVADEKKTAAAKKTAEILEKHKKAAREKAEAKSGAKTQEQVKHEPKAEAKTAVTSEPKADPDEYDRGDNPDAY